MTKKFSKLGLLIMVFVLLSPTLYSQVGRLRNIMNQSDLVNYRLVGERSQNIIYCIPNGSKVNVTLSSGKIWVDPWQIVANGVCSVGTQGTVPLTPTTTRERLELQAVSPTFGTPTKVLKLPFGAWVYGLSAIPFRVRLKQAYDVNGNRTGTASSTNFALAVYGGHTLYGWSTVTNRAIHNNAISLVAFAGPSAVDVSREIAAPATLPIKNKINATVVYGSGITFSRNALGATVYFGWENAIGTGSSLWTYNGKPFIGFGVSTGFMR